MDTQNEKPTPLFGTRDPRYGELYEAIRRTIDERNDGLLLCGVLGVIRLIEHRLIEENHE
jgi:hypothetical protein